MQGKDLYIRSMSNLTKTGGINEGKNDGKRWGQGSERNHSSIWSRSNKVSSRIELAPVKTTCAIMGASLDHTNGREIAVTVK